MKKEKVSEQAKKVTAKMQKINAKIEKQRAIVDREQKELNVLINELILIQGEFYGNLIEAKGYDPITFAEFIQEAVDGPNPRTESEHSTEYDLSEMTNAVK